MHFLNNTAASSARCGYLRRSSWLALTVALAAQIGINQSASAQTYNMVISGDRPTAFGLPVPPATGGTLLIDATANIHPSNPNNASVIYAPSGNIGWTVINQGIITAPGTAIGIRLDTAGANKIVNAGTITTSGLTSGHSAIYTNYSATGVGGSLEVDNLASGTFNCFGVDSTACISSWVPATITNAGTIRSEGTGIRQADPFGAYNFTGTSSSITNSGLVQARLSGIVLGQSTDLATIHNQAGGQIQGGVSPDDWDNSHWYSGINIYAGKNIVIQNDAGATISGGFGIASYNYGGSSNLRQQVNITVINAGTISGQNQAGIQLANGGSVTNLSGGIISGATGIIAGYNPVWSIAVDSPTIITNAGTITGTGGIAVLLGGSSFSNTLTLQTGSVINGIVSSSSGLDKLVLTGTGVDGQTDTVNTQINGQYFYTDQKFNNFGQLIMNGDNWSLHNAGTFNDSIQVNSGTLQLTGHTTTGTMHVAPGAMLILGATDNTNSNLTADTFLIDPGATAGGYGSVASSSWWAPTTVVNNGTLAVGAALAALGDGPVGSLMIAGTLDNGGTVLLGKTSTVGNQLIVQSYNGRNGTLVFNTALGDDNSATDQMIINGGTATGSTKVQVVNAGGLGTVTTGNGILLIDAQNGATTEATAFKQAGRISAGAYEYTLYRGSHDASAPDSWFLRSERQVAPDPTPGPGPTDQTPGPGPVPIPDYRQEVSLYTALPSIAATYGQTMLGTLHQRRGDEGNPGTLGSNASWTRMLASHTHNDGSNDGIYGSSPRYSTDTWAIQSGFDIYRDQNSTGGRDLAGVYLAVGSARADVWHYTGARAGQDTLMGYTAGAYWTHFGATGWYVDAVAQATYYDMKAEGNGPGAQSLNTHGTGFATSLEAGYPIHLGGRSWSIEPQAQLIAQWLDLDAASDAVSRVSFSDGTALTGRVGVRLARNWTYASGTEQRNVNLWFRPNVWHEFKGDPRTTVAGLDGQNAVGFHSDLGGTWAEFNMGLSADLNRRASLYVNASYNRGLSGNDRDGYDGQAGIKVVW